MIFWLALSILFAPILAAVGLNQRQAQRDARQAAEQEERQRAETEDDRLRLERQQQEERRRREAAEEQQREREYVIRGGGLRRWLEQLQLAEGLSTRIRDARQIPMRDAAQRARTLADRCHAALPPMDFAWLVAGAAVFGVVWAIAGATNLFLDVEVFRGIGHGYELAVPLAVLLVLGFAVVGIVLTDLLGFTHVLPGINGLSRRVRIALPIGIGLALCICLSQLPRIVEHRSADVAATVRKYDAQVALLKTAQAPAELIHQAENKAAAAHDRLKAAKDVDAGLAIVAAVIEIATSWAAIMLGLLLVAESAKRGAREVDESADTLQRESDGAPDRIRGTVLERVIGLRMTDEEVALAFQAPTAAPAGLLTGEPVQDADVVDGTDEDVPPDDDANEDDDEPGTSGGPPNHSSPDPPAPGPPDRPPPSDAGDETSGQSTDDSTNPDGPGLFGSAI